MQRRTLLQAAPALLGLPGLSRAQSAYPSKAIRYIVPVSAGGVGARWTGLPSYQPM